MGEVYKACDSRLDRIVAIKVLPARLAADPQFLERFDREARSISALNHPNICTLYDVGEASIAGSHASTHFLVMEYLEGETLAERLGRGPLTVAEALRIASGIISALDEAHRHGIIHRDLKPGNVFLVRGSSSSAVPTAKLLDFGLAKLASATSLSGGLITATATAPLTARGTILGTLQYMAPEQIEGGEADARTDIFAFGALVYEIVTSRKAFDGRSQASLLGAILKDDPPPISQLQPLAPRPSTFWSARAWQRTLTHVFRPPMMSCSPSHGSRRVAAPPAWRRRSSCIASAASALCGWPLQSHWPFRPAGPSGGSCVRRRSATSSRGSSFRSPKARPSLARADTSWRSRQTAPRSLPRQPALVTCAPWIAWTPSLYVERTKIRVSRSFLQTGRGSPTLPAAVGR